MLRNTTNIPDRLIVAAILHGLPENTPPPRIVEVLNKQVGRVNGQWGWYHPNEQRVVVYVPRELSQPRTFIKKYSNRKLTVASRADVLVAVTAHELRHHYQHIHWNTDTAKWRLAPNRLGKIAREVDAELYEIAMLEKWKLKFTQ